MWALKVLSRCIRFSDSVSGTLSSCAGLVCSKYHGRYIDQGNKFGSPGINLYIYDLLIFDNDAKKKKKKKGCMRNSLPSAWPAPGGWASHCLFHHSSVRGHLRPSGASPRALIWLLAQFPSWIKGPIPTRRLKSSAQALLQTRLKSISHLHLAQMPSWSHSRPKFHRRREVKKVEYSSLLKELII